MKARILIEEEGEDLKGEALASAFETMLGHHGLSFKEESNYETPGWQGRDNQKVNWQTFDGLTISMAPAPDVHVMATTWITPGWQTYAGRVDISYGNKSRSSSFSYSGPDDSQMIHKFDKALTKLKRRLKLYKPKTERGLDKIITPLGYK